MIPLFLRAAAAAALIVLAAELFVNGVEWLAHRWRLGPAGTGSVLAALGGTLPETLVTLLAALGGAGGVSTGTALGSPAVLATLAFGLVGWAAGRARAPRPAAVERRGGAGPGEAASAAPGVRRNLLWFGALFAAAVALAALPAPGLRPAAAPFFLAAWAVFCLRSWDRGERRGPPPPLLFRLPAAGRLPWLVLQTLAGCAGLAFGAELLVHALEELSRAWQLPSLVVSLTLAPLATELPEITTAALWALRGKLDLALQNVSGALVMSATLPVAVSLALCPWHLGPAALVAAGAAGVGAAFAWRGAAGARGWLLACGAIFVAYLAVLLV
ncbi:MAG: hypothetical protein IMW98_08730 [Firmicutes bacterium]|nr:hypothetical protein [Bacillota bacterium]MBE3590891.1 hypothetical protein [Bacillota bacterium]